MIDIGTRSPIVAHPDDQLEDALSLMLQAGVGRLPVVDRSDPTRLLGMLSRGSVATAYHAVLDDEQAREASSIARPIRSVGRRVRQETGATTR